MTLGLHYTLRHMRSYLAGFQRVCCRRDPCYAAAPAFTQGGQPATDPVQTLVGRLDLEKYKATIKGLTQFGDRRQGTERNREAVDWIEAQLKSYGCPTERIKYDYRPPPPDRAGGSGAGAPAAADRRSPRRRAAAGRAASARRTGVNTDPMQQPDEKLRALNTQPATPGPREEVYCTKVGTTHPDEMYIVGAHMDGHGWGEAANDDGSGTALVMELARIFSMPGRADRAHDPLRAVEQRRDRPERRARLRRAARRRCRARKTRRDRARYPEPKWLGMIQHDMMMFDHGMPRADGTMQPRAAARSRRQHRVPVDGEAGRRGAEAGLVRSSGANEKYATDYPAAVGPHMTNTDSTPFMDLVPAISLRENERGMQIGSGWDPQWHQPTDVFATFTDKDFRLGLNAAQTTLGAVAQLTGAAMKK